jgi:hypothetical protein
MRKRIETQETGNSPCWSLKRSSFLGEQVPVTGFEKWLETDVASTVFLKIGEKPEL